MIKITRWKTDNCGCIAEYSWDDEVPQDDRTHTLVQITKCNIHTNLSDQGAYQQMQNDALDRAIALRIAAEEHPDVSAEAKLNNDRKVDVEIPIPANQKAELQARYDTDMPNKVIVR